MFSLNEGFPLPPTANFHLIENLSVAFAYARLPFSEIDIPPCICGPFERQKPTNFLRTLGHY